MNFLNKEKAFELLNSLSYLLDNNTTLNKDTLRKYLGIIIGVG